MNNNLFPVLKECYVNIQTETGDVWGGLERCGFTEKQLEKNIHTVTVSLCWFYDEDEEPSNLYEDSLMVIDSCFRSRFGIIIDPSEYGGMLDPKEGTHWFINHSNAEKFANVLFHHLKTIGYKPIKSYNW